MNGTMLDETDHNIIQVLCEDARTSLRKISERIGVSLGAVSNRVKKLEERGIIKGYSVLLDHEKIGWELNVVIGLRIQKGRLIEIQEKIAKDNRIYGAYDVTGDFDSMILARAENRKDLDNLSKNVLSIEGVERSVTHLVLNTVKEIPSSIPIHKFDK
ncbi:MAG: Lrp/AsnC family transcriptional regulator [Candidatus Poseidoniales archaeon]|jgi:DNA-binding Lrp family transcriptional regulator|tara:strand:+ start:21847 stop:22320 length:474 start_codon:yes stop_codon:yes gene_type:complete